MGELNEIIHQPTRLRIMAVLVVLDPDEKMEFTGLSKLLSLTDGNLGAHLLKLEEAGYLQVEKLFVERKPKSLIAVTTRGHLAFEVHVAALKELLANPVKSTATQRTVLTKTKSTPPEEAPSFTSPLAEGTFLD